MAQVIPDGVRWVRDAAAEFRPEANQVMLQSGAAVSYDYLVVAMGLQCDWGLIRGLPEALARGDGVCSNYGESHTIGHLLVVRPCSQAHMHKCDTTDPKHAAATWQAIQRLGVEGGNAIFTQPDTPVKCGGAPQKIMWLTEDYLQREGKRVREMVYIFASVRTCQSKQPTPCDTHPKTKHTHNRTRPRSTLPSRPRRCSGSIR